MIRFCYSPDGNYDLQTLPDRIESFLIDKKNQKLRVFDTEDFYFSVLDSSYIDSSDPSVGLSMLGANRLYNELDLLGQAFDNYTNDNDAEINAINEHLAISDGSISETNSSVSDLESRIGQFNFNKNYVYAVNSSDGGSGLDIAYGQGDVIFRFDDGHIHTKYFDSSWVLNEIEYIEDNAVMTALTDTPYSDLDVVDPSGNVILRLNEGHIQTKNFNSIDCSAFDFDKDYPYTISHVYSQKDESDFDLADSSGNVLVRFVNGHIKTKNFDSENIDSSFANIISYIDTKDQEILSSCIDRIDVLQEDYRNYKIQINTDFTNLKNDINTENSSFREKFESYWIECEKVVTEAMTDLDLKVQTLDSSVNLAISNTNSSIISYIDVKVQEVLNSCLDQIDDISKTVDDCKNDVSVYKKEVDKLDSDFNILNDNVSTYKNSVTSLQEDYRNYKVQIETAFENFKNNVNAENSSFREKFESYWVECEEVVTAAMTTLDSSVNLAISDILRRLDALENKS